MWEVGSLPSSGKLCPNSPPHAVQEGPFTILELRVSLNEEDKRSEGENSHSNQDHHQAKLLVSLLQSVCERLDASKMSDKLEDSHDSHHSHKSDHFPRLANHLRRIYFFDPTMSELELVLVPSYLPVPPVPGSRTQARLP